MGILGLHSEMLACLTLIHLSAPCGKGVGVAAQPVSGHSRQLFFRTVMPGEQELESGASHCAALRCPSSRTVVLLA